MKSIALLGSTGSIGVNVLNIVRKHPKLYRIVGLAAGSNAKLAAEQVREFAPVVVSMATREKADELGELLAGDKPRILFGESGIREVATTRGTDLLFSAVVGAAGLPPTWAALDSGIDVALANKETLVTAGPLILDLVRRRKVSLFPVDSEHSAVFQSLVGHNKGDIEKIILTASGGPFRGRDPKTFDDITPDEAMAHPTWNMGAKITIDSATLMNKGLEVIEARWLFDTPPGRIGVVIHPDSIIHSMVEFRDGQIIAQLGMPDMRGPIAYALSYPERLPDVMPKLDLTAIGRLNFHEVDGRAFPCLGLAYKALEMSPDAPAVLNGANEAAVAAFLGKKIRFTDIPKIVGKTMETESGYSLSNLIEVMEADARARKTAGRLIRELKPERLKIENAPNYP